MREAPPTRREEFLAGLLAAWFVPSATPDERRRLFLVARDAVAGAQAVRL